jgi:hypothetical protein
VNALSIVGARPELIGTGADRVLAAARHSRAPGPSPRLVGDGAAAK